MISMKQFLLALCGIPASGKSTLAYAIEERIEHVKVVSTDKWRDDEYYRDFTPKREQMVRRGALEEVRREINAGFSVVHDDTNYYQSMRHELYEIAKDRECVFAIVHVNTSLDIALEWNKKRKTKIPDEVIERIYERFDRPGKKYTWDQPIMTVNLLVMPVDSIVKDLTERIGTLHPLRGPAYPKIKHHDEGALLDVITRQVVNNFLKEMPTYRQDPRVSKLRKEVLREAKERNLSPYETEQALRVRLGILSARVS